VASARLFLNDSMFSLRLPQLHARRQSGAAFQLNYCPLVRTYIVTRTIFRAVVACFLSTFQLVFRRDALSA